MTRVTLLASLVCVSGCAAKQPAPPSAAPPHAPPPAAAEATKPPPPPVTHEPDVPRGEAAARVADLAQRARAIVAVFNTSNARLTPDRKTVVFTSNRDGLPALYTADARDPASKATRLVELEERVGGFLLTRDGKSVIFRSDRGANESWSIFRVGLDGKDLVELTPGEKLQRDVPIEPDRARGRIYYSARRIEDVGSAVYELALAPGSAPRRVHETPVPSELADVSPDGKLLAVVRFPSNTENYLDAVDAATGAARTLYPRDGKVQIESVSFTPDGKRLVVGTDAGGDQGVVLALDVKTGKELARHTEAAPGASIACVAPRRGTRVACRALIGNRAEVRLLDARTLRPAAQVPLPPGTGSVTDFTDDGAGVTVTWSTPEIPLDVFHVNARTGAVTPLRKDPRPGLDGLPRVELSTASLDAHDGLKIPLNIYLPADRPEGKRLPVIVSYHGGPAGVSTLSWSPLRRFWLAQGYAFVEPNVRGSSGYGRAFEMADNGPLRAEAFKDVEAAGRWVAAQPWADRERLVIYGGSYGGYTVLIGLTRMPDLWRAGVNLFGVVNMHSFLKTTSGLIREIFKLEFGDLGEERDRAVLEAMSPIRDVAKIVDPLFVYAGANDPRVPRGESDQIVRALRERGVLVEYMVAENEGHSLARRETQVEFLARAARFLENVLR
jgi:dipeptidyl aminopeptidase/acylaminoacyl peptidase